MSLKDFELKYDLIMDAKISTIERNRKLRRLMTEMEIEFNIPLINDEAWNAGNKEVIEVYRTISNSRIFY